MNEKDVIIVGGGLAGLTCAFQLEQAGINYRVFEAGDAIGGRVRTDDIDGFKLDRGFQVFSTAYPEAKATLDFEELQFGHFEPGALVQYGGKFHRFVDPWRRPKHIISTAVSPIASIMDKLRVAALRRRVCKGSIHDLYDRPEQRTIDALKSAGFSNNIIERFFRPFLGGVFLEPNLSTSSKKFEFVFRMFAQGDAVLPKGGMQQIPKQINAKLKNGTVQTGTPIKSVQPDGVRLNDGTEIPADSVVLACDEYAANKLMGKKDGKQWHSATTIYFAADKAPVDEPILILNGEGQGPVNNLCVPSQVDSSYAPAGQSLISISVINDHQRSDDNDLLETVTKQMQGWFGSTVNTWRHLKTYRIKHALPNQDPPALSTVEKASLRKDGLFVCGDYMDTASINGAMAAGRRAANAVLDHKALTSTTS